MNMSNEQIRAVASMLTDDPDIIVNEGVVLEWFGRGPQLSPIQRKLAAATGIKDAAKLEQMEQEFGKFVQYRKSLQSKGEEAAIEAFARYKKTGEMPRNSNLPDSMDDLGGNDFRSGTRDQVSGFGRSRPRR